jgi:predicted nucleic acid-binding protein
VILVDSNIPMYLVGAPHAHKSDARRLLEKVVSERQSLVTDAGVLQEILHRYVAIDRRDAIQPAFDALIGIVHQGWLLIGPSQSVRSKLSWGIGSCLREMRCISPSWNTMESSKS